MDDAALLRTHRFGALAAAALARAIGETVREFLQRFLTPIEIAFDIDGDTIAVFAFNLWHHAIDEVLKRFERAAFATD